MITATNMAALTPRVIQPSFPSFIEGLPLSRVSPVPVHRHGPMNHGMPALSSAAASGPLGPTRPVTPLAVNTHRRLLTCPASSSSSSFTICIWMFCVNEVPLRLCTWRAA